MNSKTLKNDQINKVENIKEKVRKINLKNC